MKTKLLAVLFVALLCLTNSLFAQQSVSYTDAITRIAVRIEDKLNGIAPVAIIRFDSSSVRFSSRVIDDLTETLLNDGVRVVDRKNLEDVMGEQNFQMSGYVSDESAVGIGKMLGAQSIVIGSGENMMDYYRAQVRMLSVETGEVQVQVSQNIRYDSAMRRLLSNRADDSSIGNTHFAAGARLGAGFEINSAHSDMVGTEDTPKEESLVAFTASLFFMFRFNDHFGIQPELNVMLNNGIEATYTDGTQIKAAYNSLDIPVLLYYNFILSPVLVRISVGPYIAIPVGKINVEVPGLTGASGFENHGFMWGVAGGFGIGFRLGPGSIIGDVRYLNDFTENIITYNGSEQKGFLRRSISTTIGYELSL